MRIKYLFSLNVKRILRLFGLNLIEQSDYEFYTSYALSNQIVKKLRELFSIKKIIKDYSFQINFPSDTSYIKIFKLQLCDDYYADAYF